MLIPLDVRTKISMLFLEATFSQEEFATIVTALMTQNWQQVTQLIDDILEQKEEN